MIWALIPSWLKYSLAALVAAFLLAACGYTYGTIKERQRAALAAAEVTARAIQKRAGVDEKIIGMDAVALCNELGGLPEQCNELRRVEADQP
ncbi:MULTISPECIES: hypothetical protein [unclassified Brucella]|uniref:hypothetical protein n=2 Tax=Brucella TaxID=234 RepID=UPI0012AD6B84|nr:MULTISPECIES: hypothetical protein [unclassified Brucella]MRN58745.1 hypothetical protein [Brucella sp. 09RB8918]CAB4327569.1 hypothetical protein BCH_02980 [Brucella sp. 191011898]